MPIGDLGLHGHANKFFSLGVFPSGPGTSSTTNHRFKSIYQSRFISSALSTPPPPFRNYTYQSYLTIHYNFVKELVDFPTFSKFFMHAWNRCGGLNKEHSMLVHSGAESIVTTSRHAEMEPKLQLNERATLR